MKKISLLTGILLITITFFSFKKKHFDPLAITGIISENTFLDVFEVTNLNWREYMSWNENQFGKDSKEYLASLPDQTVWEGKKYEAAKKMYLHHASFNNYPVVGISHAQANAYCKWRAARINEIIKIQNKKSSITYSCRLPTKAEWERLARIEAYYFAPYKNDNHNLQKVTDDGVINENDITSPVKSFTPTLNGYYNLMGNVAEMVTEKGIAKGASWQHTNIGLTHETDYTYTNPTKWVGFRCVLERNN